MFQRPRCKALACALTVATLAVLTAPAHAAGGQSPELRLSPTNRVPSCAAPDRLMAFLRARNDKLDPRYADLARFYREHGEAWRVRWDYAFFQMLVETGNLTYKGDVKPKQNNFAGIGTTGGGVKGDAYPDIRTGVLAHIQHLVAYSGELMQQPVAPRTQLKQADIVEISLKLKRPVRFADLARRWAVDKRYWASIEATADAFQAQHCITTADRAPLPETKALSLVAAHGSAAKTSAGKTSAGKTGDKAAADTGAPVPPAPIVMAHAPVQAQAPAPTPARRPQAPPASPIRTVWSTASQGAGTPVPTAPAGAPQAAAVQGSGPIAQLAGAPASLAPPSTNSAQASAAPPAPVPAPAALAEAGVQPGSAPARSHPFAFAGAARLGGPLPSSAAAAPSASAAAASPSAAVAAPAFAPGSGCAVTTASYGGRKALLIRAEQGGIQRYTALTVHEGFEASMAQSYIRAHAHGGSTVGEFGSSAEAVAHARTLCPAN